MIYHYFVWLSYVCVLCFALSLADFFSSLTEGLIFSLKMDAIIILLFVSSLRCNLGFIIYLHLLVYFYEKLKIPNFCSLNLSKYDQDIEGNYLYDCLNSSWCWLPPNLAYTLCVASTEIYNVKYVLYVHEIYNVKYILYI